MQDKPDNNDTPETPLVRLGPGGDFTRDVHGHQIIGVDPAKGPDYTREVLLCNGVVIAMSNDPFNVTVPADWSVAD